ncbi:hemolysin III family protein [Pigmentiphaga aceris]|uniref:Hemolysin III family protein n=1 Tax=Pigmentiphaga aceris TaxID=1940612 RepID=A0A5C0AWX5_9BURK|nr:hemolysin III family protein [Pigmentiphaga aceris]QEI05211.1 hemolysin III family protein [Pigmentiphaga aceris]
MYQGERFNGYSHLVGTLLAVFGTVALLWSSVQQGDVWRIVSSAIYGTTLILLYLFSTLYHSVQGPRKPLFRRLDHCAIFLLIAGSYTPFALVTLRGPWGWGLFALNWTLALIGIVQEMRVGRRSRALSIAVYVVMGWMVLFAIKPLMDALPSAGMAWLAAGGLFYTGGVVFYALDKKVRHFHGIWHLFVMAGSACQFISIFYYV